MEINKDDIALIWFQSTTDVENIQDDLQAAQNCLVFVDDIDACVTEIKSTKEKIFLIISGNKAYGLLPHVIHQSQLDLIFIYPAIPNDYKRLHDDYPKVLGIFHDSKDLIKSIRENMKKVNRQMEVISFYDQYQRGTRDLEEQSTEFLWFRLFKDVIGCLPHDEKFKTKMLVICRQYYRDNPRILKDIDQFEKFYRSDDCIQWYTKETFIYRLINKALRTEDIEQLYVFRYYISDLSKELAHKYQLMKNQLEKRFRLYRGAPTHKAEFEKLQTNIGKTFAVNSYWSTSRSRSCALTFAKSSIDPINVVAVLYEIECNLENENDSAIFADISNLSYFSSEEEVLFDAGSVFRLENIKEETDDGVKVYTIHIKAIEEDKKLENEYREYNRVQMEREGPRIMLSTLLKRMGKFRKSLEFLHYQSENPDGENLAYIHYRLGIAYKDNGEHELALEYLKKASTENSDSDKIFSAYIRYHEGLVYIKQKDYDQALQCCQDAISILKSQIDNLDPEIAQFYNSIGRIYRYQKDFDRALEYQQKALKIKESLMPYHTTNVFIYAELASIYSDQKKYDMAIQYRVKALEIRKRFFPKDSSCIAWGLHRLGQMYSKTNDLLKAREYYQEALEIFRKYTKTILCSKIPEILDDIAATYEHNSQKALDYRFEASKFRSEIRQALVNTETNHVTL